LKDGSELADVTTGGRLFHTCAAATPNAQSPMVRSLVCRTMQQYAKHLVVDVGDAVTYVIQVEHISLNLKYL